MLIQGSLLGHLFLSPFIHPVVVLQIPDPVDFSLLMYGTEGGPKFWGPPNFGGPRSLNRVNPPLPPAALETPVRSTSSKGIARKT